MVCNVEEQREEEAAEDELVKRMGWAQKRQAKVEEIQANIKAAQRRHDNMKVADLKLDLRVAEKKWKVFEKSLADFIDATPHASLSAADKERASSVAPSLRKVDRLRTDTAQEDARTRAAALQQAFQLYFHPEKPRPPSPPRGPVKHNVQVSFSGNEYHGDFLPWKRERHGHGETRLSDGSSCEGTYVRDKVHGAGLLRYADGVRLYSGAWRRGQRHGPGLLVARHGVQEIRCESLSAPTSTGQKRMSARFIFSFISSTIIIL